MTTDRNLDLDVDLEEGGARVMVSAAWAFTRHDGDPVISNECQSFAEIDREISRLESELEDVRARAREHFGDARPPEASTEPASAPRPTRHMATLMDLVDGASVRDVMTPKVQTLSPNDRLRVADEMMRAGRFRHLVVCEDEQVVGIVSQRDIVLAGISWALGIGKSAHDKALEFCSVKEVMTGSVATVDPDMPLSDAARQMTERKIGCLPVVAGGELVGILTEGDFVAMLTAESR